MKHKKMFDRKIYLAVTKPGKLPILVIFSGCRTAVRISIVNYSRKNNNRNVNFNNVSKCLNFGELNEELQ